MRADAMDYVWAYIFVNAASFILVVASGVLPVGSQLFASPVDITNQFNLTVFAGLTAGGVVLGVLGVLLRQYVYAAGVIVLWCIGLLYPIVWWFIGGLPIMLANILSPVDLSWLSSSIVAFATVHLFMFMISLAAGRDVG